MIIILNYQQLYVVFDQLYTINKLLHLTSNFSKTIFEHTIIHAEKIFQIFILLGPRFLKYSPL